MSSEPSLSVRALTSFPPSVSSLHISCAIIAITKFLPTLQLHQLVQSIAIVVAGLLSLIMGKRGRLQTTDAEETVRSLCRIGSISHKGLEELLRRVRAEPSILEIGHTELTRQMHARFEEVRCSIDIKLTGGDIFKWDIADPVLLASKLIRERPNVRAAYLDGLRRAPCSKRNPWHCIIGFDEFSPGNKLKVNNRRKSMVLSFSFSELGFNCLGYDSMWITPVVMRHVTIQNIEGGWSHALTALLRLMFYGPHGFMTAGLPVTDEQGNLLAIVHATLGVLFSDGDGLRSGLDWKGASGTKPCFCHWNVLNKESDLIEMDDATYVDITCSSPARFKRWTQDELYATVDMVNAAWRRVQAGTMSNAALHRLEQATGYNATPFGILADVELRTSLNVYSKTKYDWMHSMLQNGTLTEEIYLFTQACNELGYRHHQLADYLKSEWVFPHCRKSQSRGLWHVFDAFRSRSSAEAERLKASASEILGIYSVVRHWVATVVGLQPEIADKRASFEAGCATLDIMLQTKKGFYTTAQGSAALLHATERHLQLHIAAYGVDKVKPKHHWMFDVAEMMKDTPVIIDAFIIERLHLRAKRHADPVKELKVYEKATLAGVINEQFEDAKRPLTDGLRGKPVEYDGALVCDHMNVGATGFSTGDVVSRGAQMGVIAICVEEDGVLMSIVDELSPIEQVTLFPKFKMKVVNNYIWMLCKPFIYKYS